jgi:DNA-binding CsgD family transcriptional regulator
MTATIDDSCSTARETGRRLARSTGQGASGKIREIFRGPRLADRPAAPVLAPALHDPGADRIWVLAVFLLGAIARETLGDSDAAGRSLRPLAADAVLTHGETRVLHYLPTNLSAREIARELFLSVNTIKTHQRHLYAKLGARNRSQAVERARALGLLAPAPRRR